MAISSRATSFPIKDPKSQKPTREEDIELQNQLGAGNYAEVYRGVIKSTQQTVAVKSIDMRAQNIEKCRHEVSIMQHVTDMGAKGNIALIAAFKGNIHYKRYFIIMEFASGHDLSYLLKNESPRPLEFKVSTTVHLIQAVKFLHQNKTLHCDIKPENVLFNGPELKLTDYGLSLLEDKDELFQHRGSPKYMAPEILAAAFPDLDYLTGCLSRESDIWSLVHVILLIFKWQNEPYLDFTTMEKLGSYIIDYNRREPIPSDCPKPIKSIYVKGTLFHPEERPYIEEIEKIALDYCKEAKIRL